MQHELPTSEIGNQIHMIRGRRVMLDHALAKFYHVETKTLKRAVKRNISRFPNDFMYVLNEAEVNCLRYQIGTSNFQEGNDRGGNRYRSFAFTEPGVAMLSSVLNSERAVQVNIEIMRAFIQLRETEEKAVGTTLRIERLEERFAALENKLTQILVQLQSYSNSSFQIKTLSTVPAQSIRRPNATIEAIQKAVAKYFGMACDELKSHGRQISIVRPRQIAMYLVRQYTGLSYKRIGNIFGGKDHSTVLHGCQKVEIEIATTNEVREVVDSLQNLLQTRGITPINPNL